MERVVVKLLIQEIRGELVAQGVPCGKVMVKLGMRRKAFLQVFSRENNVCNGALHVIGLCGRGDMVSLFLKDWELAWVALSCHIALVLLCQEMHEAW